MDNKTLEMIESIQQLSTMTKVHDKELDQLEIELSAQHHKLTNLEKRNIDYDHDIQHLYKKMKRMSAKLEHSGVSYFIRTNWWKIGGFILTFSTILGAIGEYLYRLPPPK